MSGIQWSMKDMPKSKSTARFSTTSNQSCTGRSPTFSNICMIPSMCTACLVAVRRLGKSAGSIWLHICQDKSNLLIRFRLASVSGGHATIRSKFAQRPINIHKPYRGRWTKEAKSYGSSSNAMSTPYEFDTGSRFFVTKIFRDVISMLSSLSGPAGSEVFVVGAMTFIGIKIIYVLWSISPVRRSIFSKSTLSLLAILSFPTGPGEPW